jgi:TetR/AcrR family transcriptional regulator
MNQVAEACGVSKPSHYPTTSDKDRLLVEIAQGHVDSCARSSERGRAAAPPRRVCAPDRAFMAAYADSQAQHRVLTEDVKFLRGRRSRVPRREREVVAASRSASRGGPDWAASCDKPLTMLLFGMMNWMFTWLRRTAADPSDMTPVVADLFFGGLRVRAPPRSSLPAAGRPARHAPSAAAPRPRPPDHHSSCNHRPETHSMNNPSEAG